MAEWQALGRLSCQARSVQRRLLRRTIERNGREEDRALPEIYLDDNPGRRPKFRKPQFLRPDQSSAVAGANRIGPEPHDSDPIGGVFVAPRCALIIFFRLATSLRRNEARWRNEKGSLIKIAGATALHIFFWRQIPQFDRQFLLGRFLFRHLDRSLDVWASGERDFPTQNNSAIIRFHP